MGIFDSIFGNKNKSALEEELNKLRQEITCERELLSKLKEQTASAIADKDSLLEQYKNEALKASRQEHETLQAKVADLKAEVVELEEKVLLQSFSLYQPMYTFAQADDYKAALEDVRTHQKMMIKDGTAVSGAVDWTVNGSRVEGNRMVRDTQKLLLRAFNSECEFVTWQVKYNNFDSCRKRIEKAYSAIQKLGTTMSIEISREYFDLKIEELHLALEYQQAKERQREEQRELRERQREELALKKELEESRRKVEKERSHYLNALKTARKQLETADDVGRLALQDKINSLEEQLGETDKNLADLDYRAANQRAGYVYIISNIGSFGDDVYKIGMTRRLEPQERIDELSGASVPFKFDVHALIFTEDAPALEAALHRAFEDRKLNLVNPRREFFHVTLAEIEKVVRDNYDKSVEFIREPAAEQYRESEKLRDRKNVWCDCHDNT